VGLRVLEKREGAERADDDTSLNQSGGRGAGSINLTSVPVAGVTNGLTYQN
jgi:hypothetical protein